MERVRFLTQGGGRCRKGRSCLTIILLVLVACFQCAGSGIGLRRRQIRRPSEGGIRVHHWRSDSPLGDPGPEFFARNGLDTELIFIASSSHGMPALLAGEIPIYSGSLETAAQAAAAGADVVIIASSEPTPYKLIVQPGIKSVSGPQRKKDWY